ncbi:MAG: hypothetical protein R3F59_02830 [Myxococcota bacterium]
MMLLLALFGAGCPAEIAEKNCAVRTAYYPDADGDGYGEPTDVFVGWRGAAGVGSRRCRQRRSP